MQHTLLVVDDSEINRDMLRRPEALEIMSPPDDGLPTVARSFGTLQD